MPHINAKAENNKKTSEIPTWSIIVYVISIIVASILSIFAFYYVFQCEMNTHTIANTILTLNHAYAGIFHC